MNQDFIKDGKIKVSDYLKTENKELKVLGFKRVSLSN